MLQKMEQQACGLQLVTLLRVQNHLLTQPAPLQASPIASATGGSVTEGFKATSLAKLNDCVMGTTWTIDATTTTGVVEYTGKIGGKEIASADAGCKALTPQFGAIGK